MERKRAHALRWLVFAALVALLAVAAGCGGGSDDGGGEAEPAATTAAAETQPAEETAPAETAEAASGLGSEFDVASAGDVTLKLWWLGDLEAPGIEPWMDEMVAAFQSEYPNVTVETTLYETGKWIQTQATACQSKSGPDLWYNWSGPGRSSPPGRAAPSRTRSS